MTISSTSSRMDYTGNGVTDVFPYNFPIFDSGDLVVSVLPVSTGVEYNMVLDTDYTVSGVGEQAGGDVTVTTPLPSGDAMVIRRVLPPVQEIDIRNQGAFYPEVHEEAFDRHVMMVQQLIEEVARSVKIPITSGTNPDDYLTEAAASAAAAAASEAAAGLSESAAAASEAAAAADAAQTAADVISTASILAASVPRTSATGSAVIPAGTVAQRDGTPVAGYMRWNSDFTAVEVFDGTSWTSIGGAAPPMRLNRTVITTTGAGTFTTPYDIDEASVFRIKLIGGGGGGGAKAGGVVCGGGGAGGYAEFDISGLSPSTGYAAAVGVAGAGGVPDGAGVNGGDTSITIGVTTYTCSGGTGGSLPSGSGFTICAAQGAVSASITALPSAVVTKQHRGISGFYNAATAYVVSKGGAVPSGDGGDTFQAISATGYGSGGCGGVGGGNGNDGCQGLIVIDWVA